MDTPNYLAQQTNGSIQLTDTATNLLPQRIIMMAGLMDTEIHWRTRTYLVGSPNSWTHRTNGETLLLDTPI
jgi:hypothetical protein